MDTTTLKKFAQGARRQLIEQVSARMEQVLRVDSVEVREKAKVVEQLRAEIEAHGKLAVIDRVAYTWFNRFCALRFMDVNHYTRIGAVSPVEGGTQPEVLLEAKQGHVDEELLPDVKKRQEIFDLLSGRRPSSDGQGEAYRLLLVGMCNAYGEWMPFLFEKIEDYTELLMPLDLLSENSVLHDLREALSAEACEDVEVIGWLYQYYISERKDKVFEALKQNQKIEAGDIPAATQLFTPHWIVRYLVENSLGRLWMLNHPNSGLREKMEYYIEPVDGGRLTVDGKQSSVISDQSGAQGTDHWSLETDYLKISSPEELKLLDPACGSGHILTYAFDLLAAIYEEEGYASSDVAKLILEKNIFGVEIDPRAGALAAFALVMKARAKDRRFFTRDVSPNICVLENVTFNDAELKQYMNAVGRDLFTEPLMETLRQFEQADNFGSLIRPMLTDAGYVRGLLEGKNLGGDLFLFGVHERVLKVLKQAEFLAPRYHVVVANPPYMNNKGMNEELKVFVTDYYSIAKSDLFSAYILRNMEFGLPKSYLGYVTPFVWLNLGTYQELREDLLSKKTIQSLVKPSYTSFFASAIVPLVTFVIKNSYEKTSGDYIDLGYLGSAELQPDILKEAIKNPNIGYRYQVLAEKFNKIPGSPISYSISEKIRNSFELEKIGDIMDVRSGLTTGDKPKFTRFWWEVGSKQIGFGIKKGSALPSSLKWFPLNAGGTARRWYGNRTLVINWQNDGEDIKKQPNSTIRNPNYYFQKGITWTDISSSYFCARFIEGGFIFENTGSMVFPDEKLIPAVLCYLSSSLTLYFMNVLNPTMHFGVGEVAKLPFDSSLIEDKTELLQKIFTDCVSYAKKDWNASETSWDFGKYSVLEYKINNDLLKNAYEKIRSDWKKATNEFRALELENNKIFIEAYGLHDELSSDIPLDEVTLNCNPYYRYGGKKSNEELEELLRADTMKEFISYAVGCMFGRYSLDKPGLVLANQGETLKDYLKQVPKPTFTPDEDNVIPVLEGEWFEDDIAERFKKFLRVTFGEEHYDENLAFIEEAIGRDVRSYFVKEFYKDHVQTYKKRPIYWMFSSPKGSFNVLIYMHRYQPDTVSIVLNGYLREYIKKLTAHKSQLERTSVSGSASQSQKTKALKEIQQVNKVLSELKEYEDEVLYPLATEQVKIDLDDGVKVNYGKFGGALSPIKGL